MRRSNRHVRLRQVWGGSEEFTSRHFLLISAAALSVALTTSSTLSSWAEQIKQERAPGYFIFVADGKARRVFGVLVFLRQICVDQANPVTAPGHVGQFEHHHIVMRVDDEQEGSFTASLRDPALLSASVQQQPYTSCVAVGPVIWAHLVACWGEPGGVFYAQLLIPLSGKEPTLPQHGILATNMGQSGDEISQHRS